MAACPLRIGMSLAVLDLDFQNPPLLTLQADLRGEDRTSKNRS